jgi:hypothetical protein
MNYSRFATSATELELLTFFEVAPVFADPLRPWPYTDAVYQASRGDDVLEVAISPADFDIRISSRRDGRTIYELSATAVEDVKYLLDGGRETLEVCLTSRDRLFIRLKPDISIIQSLERPF